MSLLKTTKQLVKETFRIRGERIRDLAKMMNGNKKTRDLSGNWKGAK